MMMMKFWNRISKLGVIEETDYETQRRIILLNRIAFTLFFIVLTLKTLVLALGLQQFTFQTIVTFFAVFGILLMPYFNKLGYYKFNAFAFSILAPACFLFFGTISQSANSIVNINHYYVPRIFIMGWIVFPLILIDSRKKGLLFIAILFNVICLLSFESVVNHIGVPFNSETVNFNHYESISYFMMLPIILMILAFLFLTNLNRKYEEQIIGLNTTLTNKNNDLEKYNKEIIEQKDIISVQHSELEQYNEEIICQRDLIADKNELLENAYSKIELINKKLNDSIGYAESIQRAVLDKEQLPDNYFQESFILFKPLSHVSGDFYYYKKFEINDKPCLVVAAADCTGHGIPGGFLSMLGMVLISEIIQNDIITNAADILNHLRDRIKSTLNQTGKLTDQQDGMDMALCIYYPETKEMEYAGARNPLCIVKSTGEFQLIKADKQPIGVFLKEKNFTNHHIQFDGGEMVYVFSDGLLDQFGELEEKKLKLNYLQNLLVPKAKNTCEIQKQEINSFLNEWIKPNGKNESEQMDDIVIIGMRI